jgi:hypothetical protein
MWKALLRRRTSAPASSAPLNAYERARVEWFERYGCAVVDRNRLFVGWVLTTLALLAACIALVVLLPLKTVEPYVVKVADNGLAIADRAAAQRYRPGRAERTYFVSRWVQQLLTVDPYLTERQPAKGLWVMDAFGGGSGDSRVAGHHWRDSPAGDRAVLYPHWAGRTRSPRWRGALLPCDHQGTDERAEGVLNPALAILRQRKGRCFPY